MLIERDLVGSKGPPRVVDEYPAHRFGDQVRDRKLADVAGTADGLGRGDRVADAEPVQVEHRDPAPDVG